MATVGFTIDSSQVDPAVAKLKSLTQAAAGVGSAADALKAKTATASSEVSRITAATSQSAQSLQAMTQRVSGATEAMRMLGVNSAHFTTGLKNVTTQSGLASYQLLNLSRQGNDVITMLALGANPMQIFASQAGQVYDAIAGTTGIRAGLAGLATSARSGATALVEFLGPVGLGAAGLTALGGAAWYFYSASEKARPTTEQLATAVKHLDANISALDSAVKSASEPFDKLTEKYGKNAAAIHDVLLVMAAYQKFLAQNSASKVRAMIIDSYSGLSEAVGMIDRISKATTDANHEASVQALQNRLQALKADFGLTIVQATELNKEIADLGNAKGAEAIPVFRRMIETLSQVRTATGDIPPEVQAMIERLYKASLAAGDVAKNSETIKGLFGDIAGIDLSYELRQANAELDKMTGKAQSAISYLNSAVKSSSLTAQEAGIKQKYGPTKEGRAKAAGAIAGLEFDSRAPDHSGADPILRDVLDKRQAAARAIVVKNAYQASIDSQSFSGAAASTRKLTDQQRLQEQILKDLGIGTRGYTEQLRALDAIQEKLSQSQYSYELKKITLAAQDANPQIKALKDELSTGWNTFFADIRKGEGVFKSLGDAALSVLDKILSKLEDQLLQDLFATSGASGQGGILGLISKAFVPTPNALGGVYSGPGISSYSGQVVSKPTLFPFAKGVGLMGEAGYEGIFPLHRGSDGKLGVRAQGMAANSSQRPMTNITINTPPDTHATERRQQGPNGEEVVIDIVNRGTAQGRFDKTQKRFANNVAPARRG